METFFGTNFSVLLEVTEYCLVESTVFLSRDVLLELLLQFFEIAQRTVAFYVLENMLLFLTLELHEFFLTRVYRKFLDVELVPCTLDVNLVAEQGYILMVLLPLSGIQLDN